MVKYDIIEQNNNFNRFHGRNAMVIRHGGRFLYIQHPNVRKSQHIILLCTSKLSCGDATVVYMRLKCHIQIKRIVSMESKKVKNTSLFLKQRSIFYGKNSNILTG